MSALPPKADLLGRHGKGLLLTQSGHSLDYAIEEVGTERNRFRPPACSAEKEVADVVANTANYGTC